MPAIISRAERTRRRRRALLDSAQELFAKHGYVDTSTQEVVRGIGATRGALYFHFHDKAGLFAAVYQEQHDALAHTIAERIQAAQDTTWQQVMTALCQAFIDKATDPKVRRILFVDGPAVLDLDVLRESAPVLLLLRQVFESLMAKGVTARLPLDPLVHLVWASCFAAGSYIAQAEDGDVARQEMMGTLERLFTGLELGVEEGRLR